MRRCVSPLSPAGCLLAALLLPGGLALGQQTASQLLLEGARLRALSRLPEAVAAYGQALPLCQNDTQRAQAWLALAQLYLSQNRPDKALTAYSSLAALPEAPAAFRAEAWRETGRLHTEAEHWQKAREAYDHLATDFRADPSCWWQAQVGLALLDVAQERPQEAARRLREAVAQHAEALTTPEMWAELVHVQCLADDLDGATASAASSQQRFAGDRSALLTLVEGLREADQLPRAQALVLDALSRTPTDRRLYQTAQDLFADQDKMPALAAWLEEQARQRPRQPAWLEYLTRLYNSQNQPAKALAVYDRLLALQPDRVDVLREAAQVALGADDLTRAEAWLTHARTVAPQDQGLLLALGDLRADQGRAPEAVTLWKQALAYTPQNRHSVINLAMRLRGKGLGREALAVYAEAAAALGEPQAFSYERGKVLEGLLDLPGATRAYVTALSDPDPHSASAAALALQALVQDPTTRPDVRAALGQLGPPEQLPPAAQATLLYCRLLEGEDPAKLVALLTTTSGLAEQTGLLGRVARELEEGGQTATAALLYERLLPTLPGAAQQAALALHTADLLTREGEWQRAQALLAVANTRRLDPALAAELQVRQADLLLRWGHQPEAAQALYAPVAAAAPEASAGLRARWGLADVAFARGEYEEALRQYADLLRVTAPEDAARRGLPPVILGSFYLPLDEGAPQPRPGADYVSFQQGEALLRQGQFARAREAYQQLAQASPASPYANDALARLLLLQTLERKPPGAPDYVAALAASDRGAWAEATRLLAGITSGALAPPALLLLAAVQHAAGEATAALQTLAQLAQRFADSPEAPQALLQRAQWLAASDPPGARSALELLATRYPDAPETAEGRALLGGP